MKVLLLGLPRYLHIVVLTHFFNNWFTCVLAHILTYIFTCVIASFWGSHDFLMVLSGWCCVWMFVLSMEMGWAMVTWEAICPIHSVGASHQVETVPSSSLTATDWVFSWRWNSTGCSVPGSSSSSSSMKISKSVRLPCLRTARWCLTVSTHYQVELCTWLLLYNVMTFLWYSTIWIVIISIFFITITIFPCCYLWSQRCQILISYLILEWPSKSRSCITKCR